MTHNYFHPCCNKKQGCEDKWMVAKTNQPHLSPPLPYALRRRRSLHAIPRKTSVPYRTSPCPLYFASYGIQSQQHSIIWLFASTEHCSWQVPAKKVDSGSNPFAVSHVNAECWQLHWRKHRPRLLHQVVKNPKLSTTTVPIMGMGSPS